MAGEDRWIVTVQATRGIHLVADDLRRAGFTVNRVLEAVGCITGTADGAIVPSLRAIDGVAGVSPDRPVGAGPVT